MNLLNKLPAEIRDQAIEFDAMWMGALSELAPGWGQSDIIATKRLGPEFLKARFPLPIHAPEFQEALGPIQYRELSEKFKDIDYARWQDGVSIDVDVLRSNMWTGWDRNAIAGFALAAANLTHKRAMVALESGLTYVDWDNSATVPTRFFGDHPQNPAKPDPAKINNNTIYSATIGPDLVDDIIEKFETFYGPTGQGMGLMLAGILSPPALMRSWRNVLIPPSAATTSQIVISNAGDGVNPARHAGQYWLRRADQSTEPTVSYAFATNRPDLRALFQCIKGAPTSVNVETGQVVGDEEFETIIEGLGSQLHKDKNRVGIGKVRRLEVAPGHYAAVIRIDTNAAP